MARRIFFSFHYQRDIFRVNTVRHSDVTKKNVEHSGYWDHSLWEETKRKGDAALQKLISDGLTYTSVTVVLAGAETARREWVNYELVKSFERGNGLMTVYINNIKNAPSGTIDPRGVDPLSQLYYQISADGRTASVVQNTGASWESYMTIDATSLPPAAKSAKSGFLSITAKSYDWVWENGYENFAKWIETAALAAGR
jgi:hypothetical protein